MKRVLTPLFAILIGLSSAGLASAATIGLAVADISGTALTNTISVAGDGTIGFYIPLKDESNGVFGVDAGMSSDSCYFYGVNSPNAWACGAGSMDMFLLFDPIQLGPNILTLEFNDLDISGANDPHFFLEAVTIYDTPTGTLVSSTQHHTVLSANSTSQTIALALNATSNPFVAKLTLTTEFLPTTANRWWANTQETLLATVTADPNPTTVPEATTFSLLGLGLLAVGIAGRRRDIR